MKLASVQSRRQSIATALNQTRQLTLDLFAQIEPALFFPQAHSKFSPIGWHFGHIAFTEAYWILEYLADSPPSFQQYQRLFAADGLPKQERQNLPSIATIKEYIQAIRFRTLDYLTTAPVDKQERLWRWLIQHESQHCETIIIIWKLHQQSHISVANFGESKLSKLQVNQDLINCSLNDYQEMVRVEAGKFIMGNDCVEALDNEQPAHQVYLDSYLIDRYPVTCGQYSTFMAKGGYQKREYWSQAGWRWLQQNPVDQPLYWSNSSHWTTHPVCGVSYYEAEAYANFAQKRLPTEAEWEKAAQGSSFNCNHSCLIGHTTPVATYPERSNYGCQDLLGNVWEWTSSWFAGYPRFTAYPYQSYSEVYFDRQHRVLRGGSWATSRALRSSFRNWYYPNVRQVFAGFRCVQES